MKHPQRKTGMDTFYGKYRAKVTKVYDDKEVEDRGKENRGRIKVECPKVYGDYESPWCEPLWGYCFDMHGDFVLPEVNDYVYIEFEEGNPNLPIWVGAWCKKNETPLVNEVVYAEEDEGCDVHSAPSPHVEAKTLKEFAGDEDSVYEDHHDKIRTINFGWFWLEIHRDPTWVRMYIEDPDDNKQELFELFFNPEKVWFKRKSGTMTFYSDDCETYLERGSGRFRMYTNDEEMYIQRDKLAAKYHTTPYGEAVSGSAGDMEFYSNDLMTYLTRHDSSLIMTDPDTKLYKGSNTMTMTTQDTTFDVPNNFTVNATNIVENATTLHRSNAAEVHHN